MRVGIVGSRDANPAQITRVWKYVRMLRPEDHVVVSGGARGVDLAAEQAAYEYGLECDPMPADWENLGRSAGMVRNAQLVDSVDLLVAFWDGRSRGTKNAIDHARNMVKPFVVVFE